MKLVTRGDDAGSCQSANRACREGVLAGTLKNISLMAPGPEIEHAAEILRDLDCDFGVHVTLNSEWNSIQWGPVADPSLVPNLLESTGYFTQSPKVLYERGTVNPEEAALEVQAQIAKLRSLGFKLTYLDEHMGVGWLPGFTDAFKMIAEKDELLFTSELGAIPVSFNPQTHFWEELAHLLDANKDRDTVALIVTHPGGGDDMMNFVHEGLSPGQIMRERLADTELWLSPNWHSFQPDHLQFARYSEVL